MAHNKYELRKTAKAARTACVNSGASTALIQHFPKDLPQNTIAGFASTGDEIDLWPLLHNLHQGGRQIALPVVITPNTPLEFRQWTPHCEMATDRYGIQFPKRGESILPQLILVPLLAYTNTGDRLGYGGGYYDRTLAKRRAESDIFACGVAYAGQEAAFIPTDAHDERLDGILTEDGFRQFK